MSDKPIHAEIVRADQIRVGDRILGTGGIWETVRIDVIHGCGTREFRMDRGMKLVLFDDDLVARILPEPVEVRDEWYFEGYRLASLQTEEEARKHAAKSRGLKGAILVHKRTSIISRGEVKP